MSQSQLNPFQNQTLPNVLCYGCGASMKPNPTNLCPVCVKTKIDITRGIPKSVNIIFCKFCDRYFSPPNAWIKAEERSLALAKFLVQRLPLKSVKLVDVDFVWTEPHSRRLKLKLTVEKSLFENHGIRQEFVVEYIVNTQMCPDCHQEETPHTWKCVVQLRQHVNHKRTFFFIEQLILKHDAHYQAIGVEEKHQGIDFFFKARNHGEKFLSFIQAHVPVRFKVSKSLISADYKSNIWNYKYAIAVEIVPICKDDLILLPPALARGNMAPLVICSKISNRIHLINPANRATTSVTVSEFYKRPFKSILNSRQLSNFIVMDIDLLEPPQGRYAMANISLMSEDNYGVSNQLVLGRTHLGPLLSVGDSVQCYDLSTNIVNDSEFELMKQKNPDMPDIFVVRKFYPKFKRMNFMLKKLALSSHLNKTKVEKREEQVDFQDFVTELVADPELQSHVKMYKNPNFKPADPSDPMVDMAKLLDASLGNQYYTSPGGTVLSTETPKEEDNNFITSSTTTSTAPPTMDID